MESKKVAVVDFCRSPISKAKNGALNALTGLEIATQVVKALLGRHPDLPLDRIEMLACGTAYPEGENGLNVGRQLAIKAGLPLSVAGLTINQFCASSQQAIMLIENALSLGKGELGLAVGMEHMRRVPMGGFNPYQDKGLEEKNCYISMIDTAEILAREGEISREDQESFAMESHRRALKAWKEGAFEREVVPISLSCGGALARDEFPREPNPEKIRSLKPILEGGCITAATASPLSTGVAAVLLATVEAAQGLGLPIRATIESTAIAGTDYERMGLGPIPATSKVMERTGLSMADMGVIEINEAFAAQVLACLRQGGWTDFADRLNPLGGALALGHPLGMSGARIVGTAITGMEKIGATYALATMCVGGGQGASVVLKRWQG